MSRNNAIERNTKKTSNLKPFNLIYGHFLADIDNKTYWLKARSITVVCRTIWSQINIINTQTFDSSNQTYNRCDVKFIKKVIAYYLVAKTLNNRPNCIGQKSCQLVWWKFSYLYLIWHHHSIGIFNHATSFILFILQFTLFSWTIW